jgi:hypothetical protein
LAHSTRSPDAAQSNPERINIGVGEDPTIAEFAQTLAEIVGYRGNIACDRSKPHGTPRKVVDVSRLSALGWRAKVSLRDGLERAYADVPTHAVGERRDLTGVRASGRSLRKPADFGTTLWSRAAKPPSSLGYHRWRDAPALAVRCIRGQEHAESFEVLAARHDGHGWRRRNRVRRRG